MATIYVDPEVFAALAAHRDHLSHSRQRDVSLGDAVADLLDHFRSGTRPTAPDSPTAQPAPDDTTGTPDRQPSP